jgi:hypothetical protein
MESSEQPVPPVLIEHARDIRIAARAPAFLLRSRRRAFPVFFLPVETCERSFFIPSVSDLNWEISSSAALQRWRVRARLICREGPDKAKMPHAKISSPSPPNEEFAARPKRS